MTKEALEPCVTSSENPQTKLKELEAKVAELTEALKVRERVLEHASHEIRAPLTGMMNLAEELLIAWDRLPDAERKKNLGYVVESTKRLWAFISGLLDVSKLKHGKFSFNFMKHDAVKLLQEVLDEFPNTPNGISFVAPEDIETTVLCDGIRLQQVFRNVISNAVKYGGTTNPIIVKVEPHGGKYGDGKYLQVSVKDCGLGIPKAELTQVFLPFYESTLTRKKDGGVGLGLSICKELMHAHNGKLWVESEAGSGATFFALVPYKQTKKTVSD